MAKKTNILPILLVGGAAIALFAFTKKRKRGKIEVEPTTPISETEFAKAAESGEQIEENELTPSVTNPITTAAGGAASQISELADEATGTIEAVQASVEKAKAAIQKPISVLQKIKERAKAKRAARQAARATKATAQKSYQAAIATMNNPALPAFQRQAAAAVVKAYEMKNPVAKARRVKAPKLRKPKIKKPKVRKIKVRKPGKLFGDGMPEII